MRLGLPNDRHDAQSSHAGFASEGLPRPPADIPDSRCRRSGAEIQLVARAQDDLRVAFADLPPEAGDIVAAEAGMDVV